MPQLNNVEFSQDSRGTWGPGLGFHAGQATAVPELNGSSVSVPVTSTALAASATYTGATRDRLNLTAGATALSGGIALADQPGILVSKYKGIVYTDQTGTLYIQESNDNSTWTNTATIPVSADTFTDSGWCYLSKRYYRLQYANGSTAQTTFALFDSAGAGQNDTSLAGSNATIGSTFHGTVINNIYGTYDHALMQFTASASFSLAASTTYYGPGTDMSGCENAACAFRVSGTSPNYSVYLFNGVPGHFQGGGVNTINYTGNIGIITMGLQGWPTVSTNITNNSTTNSLIIENLVVTGG